ncbi:hypothetical protein TrST_g3211 [Triparma strigata]|uniref:DNA-directed RNA polymerase n=1 Tax=Triparma strigata TaxID=1606541 RepID=A0A9W7EAL2_9STRA|nr:hypothetical protein TrST_g3211 [Triparma strigata]
MINSRAALRRLATVPYPSRPVFTLTNRRSIHSTSRLLSPTFHDSASSSPESSSSQETKSFRALSSLPNQQQSPEVSTHALSGFFAQLTQVEPPPSSQTAPASGDVDYANRPLPPNVELLDHNTGERLETLGQAQEWYEQSAHSLALHNKLNELSSADSRNDLTSLPPAQSELVRWFPPLNTAIAKEQDDCKRGLASPDRANYGPILVLLKSEKLSVIVMHTVLNEVLLNGNNGSTFLKLISSVGDAIQAELNLQKIQHEKVNGSGSFRDFTLQNIVASNSNQKQKVKRINTRCARLLDDPDFKWTAELRAKVGAYLVGALLEHAQGADGESAFVYSRYRTNSTRIVGHVKVSDFIYDKLKSQNLRDAVHIRHLPMVIPPLEWTNSSDGGYLLNKLSIMRTHGCKSQVQALDQADMTEVYKGLNALGSTGWRINGEILDIQKKAWDDGLVIGDLPSRKDFAVPPPPADFDNSNTPYKIDEKGEKVIDREADEYADFAARFKEWNQLRNEGSKVKQRNSELHSQRCDTIIKLNQAEEFRKYEDIYFGWNLDFRGRAYPVPPNLNHLGSDLCRGVLKFSEKMPLTEKGFYWLKVNLANLYGADKMSMDDRAKFVDKNWDNVVASVEDPFNNLWWNEGDEPWQCLSVCKELVKAVESGDPASFESDLYVSMDGSCNGLQHYAALGRDLEGGSAVNLTPMDLPQDVYTGVMKRVVEKVEQEVNRVVTEASTMQEIEDHQAARDIYGLVDRKVVKQTIMTSVYGVTFIGARQQIMNRLEEKYEADGRDIYDNEVEQSMWQASTYLARLTLGCLDEMFSSARATMAWLADVASIVALQKQPMSWMTPLNLPCVQPYRRKRERIVKTIVQDILLVDDEDDLPVSAQKQRSAFPPNYIHSLDSSHMLKTAIEMKKREIPFTAVHDSYWCHPANVDEMNVVLREKFVELYEQPLLEDFLVDLRRRYPGCDFPDLPEKGELDINDIKRSRYFFQ